MYMMGCWFLRSLRRVLGAVCRWVRKILNNFNWNSHSQSSQEFWMINWDYLNVMMRITSQSRFSHITHNFRNINNLDETRTKKKSDLTFLFTFFTIKISILWLFATDRRVENSFEINLCSWQFLRRKKSEEE